MRNFLQAALGEQLAGGPVRRPAAGVEAVQLVRLGVPHERVQVAAVRVYELPRRPTEGELRTLAEPWAGWRTYFAFYLWFTIAPGFNTAET